MKLTMLTKKSNGWEIVGTPHDADEVRVMATRETPLDSLSIVLTDGGHVAFSCFWFEGGPLSGPKEWRLAVHQTRPERGMEQ